MEGVGKQRECWREGKERSKDGGMQGRGKWMRDRKGGEGK